MLALRCPPAYAWIWIAVLLSPGGCKDGAASGLARCQALESAGELENAAIACSEAALADPGSKAGKDAKGRVDRLRSEAVQRRQKDEAEALARADQLERQSEASCASHDWVTRCDIGPHPGAVQHFPNRRECATFASGPGVRCQRCRCY
jgi:hypothetical protein